MILCGGPRLLGWQHSTAQHAPDHAACMRQCGRAPPGECTACLSVAAPWRWRGDWLLPGSVTAPSIMANHPQDHLVLQARQASPAPSDRASARVAMPWSPWEVSDRLRRSRWGWCRSMDPSCGAASSVKGLSCSSKLTRLLPAQHAGVTGPGWHPPGAHSKWAVYVPSGDCLPKAPHQVPLRVSQPQRSGSPAGQ